MTRRERWHELRAFIDTSPPLDDDQFHAFVDRMRAEPDAWLRRSGLVHLVRSEREIASDQQLRELATIFEGKLATFIRGTLIARLRRDPHDTEALRDAREFDHAWLRRRLPSA